MSGSRPFDDDRYPDEEFFACCFLCGKKVDPADPKRGTYEETWGCQLPIHRPCLDNVRGEPDLKLTPERQLSLLYHVALTEMSRHALHPHAA